jgi:Uma2 family endonuclease
MSTAAHPTLPLVQGEPPELHSGDEMSQPEFHRIYQRMPNEFKAELIGGIVYVSPPVGKRHGKAHMPLNTLLYTYEAHTPGVETADNATVVLGSKSQPQPDAYARTLPEYGGRSGSTPDDQYAEGPPELVAEIAYSTRSIDFHRKRRDYARNGVLEYLLLNLEGSTLHLFDLTRNQELAADPDGIVRVRTFPGLWIDPSGMLARDYPRLMATLQKGLISPEHAAFVQRLAAVASGKPST